MNVGSIAASALNAFSVDMMVTANNIANVNTRGFREQRVDLETGPNDQGVAVGAIYGRTSAASVMPNAVSTGDQGRAFAAPAFLEGSNTDVAENFVRMTATQRAFEANTAVIRTHDDITGTLLDLKI